MAYLGVPQSKLENLTTNVQIVNLSASFDGTTVTFNLQDSYGAPVYAVADRALLVTLGGITQKPGVDYTTNATTITFTTAPVSNLTIEIRKLYGVQRLLNVNDGVISPIKLTTGGPSWNSSGNVTISGDLNVAGAFNSGGNGLFWEDNEKANFGTGNDLKIYHNGTNSYIENDTGSLTFKIAGSEKLHIASDGKLLINTTTSRSFSDNSGNGPTPAIQIEATNSSAIMSIVAASTADSHRAGTINLGRHRNTTVGGTPTVVNNGDTLGAVCFSGGDGNDMLSVAAHIRGLVDGTPGSNDMPGALSFSTTPDGSSSPYLQERLRITSGGALNIGKGDESSNAANLVEMYVGATDGTYGTIRGKYNRSNEYNRSEIRFGVESNAAGKGFLAFATGNNSATERLRIASDGKIGINNNAPLYAMHFKNAMSSSPSFIHMEVTGSNTVGGGGGIAFDTSASNALSNNGLYLATISGVRNSADDGSNDLIFKTSKSGVAGDDGNTHSPKERLRITSGGNVGINRVDPDQKLNVNGNIEVNAYDNASGSGGYYTAKGLIIGNLYDAGKSYTGSDDRSGCIWQERGLDLDFATNDSLRMKITYDGRLGLNQTSINSSRMMEITQPSSYTSGLRINSAGSAGNGAYVEFFVGTANYKIGGDHGSNNLKFRKDGTELLRLTSDGHLSLVGDNQKLLIGASDDLQLYHDGNNSFIKDTGTGRLTIATSQLQLTNAADSAVMIRATQSGTVELFHNGSKRLETTNLGVKITSNLYLGGSLNGGFSYNSTANTLEFLMTTGVTHSELTSNAYVPSATATRHLGYHTKRWDKLFCDGIRFDGNNTDLTTLDDYEEGSWNPTVVGGGYSVGRAWYVKVGRKVTIFVNVGLSNPTSSAFTVTLPFAGKTSGYTGTSQGVEAHGSCMLYNANMPSSTYNVCVYCWNSHASLYASRTNMAWRQLLGNEVGSSIQFTAHYVVLA